MFVEEPFPAISSIQDEIQYQKHGPSGTGKHRDCKVIPLLPETSQEIFPSVPNNNQPSGVLLWGGTVKELPFF